MHTKTMTILALTAALFASPTFAAGIAGTWDCTVGRAEAGTLVMNAPQSLIGVPVSIQNIETASYTFTEAGSIHAVTGTVIVDGNVIKVTDGPLSNIGVRVGYYDGDISPDMLVFSISAGHGLDCLPSGAAL
jgi:hypothetical protein